MFELYTRQQANGTPNASDILQGSYPTLQEAIAAATGMEARRPVIYQRETTAVKDVRGVAVAAGADSVKVVWSK